jgi:hypothetical protein
MTTQHTPKGFQRALREAGKQDMPRTRTTTQHTSTPWEFYDGNMIAAVQGEHVATTETNADATFIVEACNAHDELVAALRFIQTRTADNTAFQKVISAALAKVTK